MSDFLSVLIWWLTIFIIGTVFLPVTTIIFRRFIDRGYIFTKVVGLLAASYFVWFLGSLHLLPFARLTLIVTLLGFSAVSIFLLNIKRKDSASPIPWRWFIFEEILFFAGLAFWSYVRATEPSIRSLEKFMDFGFVNSILRTTYFPPVDMWLAKSPDYMAGNGYFINYYYFGHYITAFLTKLSGLDSAVTYNLMIATLFAFTFTLPFSIGANLYYLFVSFRATERSRGISQNYSERSLHTPPNGGLVGMTKIVVVGLLAAFLVSLGGNLHTLYVFTTGYANDNPQPPWQLEFGIHPERYWYPNATRFIPFTIHEFPIYSFVVADLHGHVSDIPLVMLTLALLLVLITSRSGLNPIQTDSKDNLGNLRQMLAEFQNHTSVPLPTVIFLGILLATMYMTNAWDGLIYMILSGLVFLYLNISRGDRTREALPFWTSVYKTFSGCLFLLFFFLLASLPFSLNFRPFVSGVGVLCAPKSLLGKSLGPFLFETGKCQKSPFYMLAILWGFFYFNVIGYLIFVIVPNLRNKLTNKEDKKKLVFWKFKNWKLFGNWKLEVGNLNPVDIFILLLIFISTLLLIFPEYFYIKDIYPAHYRANTMFKLGYQAFMLLGIASAYIFIRIKGLKEKRFRIFVYNIFFFILFFLVAIYPHFAVNSYYGNLKDYRGLYGLSWMANQYPDDYNAVNWMRKNITGQPVIVEANGDSYTDYDRVSANTGLPTIIGWPVHEWLWRGSYDEAGRRIPEVAAIYESTDLEKTKEILKKYNAQYIFVGTLEREKYKMLNEEKLNSLGTVIFESGTTKVIKIST